jgi:hypothetical protein
VIDVMQSDEEGRREAIDAILAASPMQVPADPRQIRQELDRAHDPLGRGGRLRWGVTSLHWVDPATDALGELLAEE